MRHWILALLVALLPLRGWMGEAMATDMASAHLQQVQVQQKAQGDAHGQQGHGQQAHAQHAHDHGGSAHGEHATLHEASTADPDCGNHAAGAQSHGGCDSCSACQTCHSVALAASLPELKPALAQRSATLGGAAQFASAEAAPGHKPPIS